MIPTPDLRPTERFSNRVGHYVRARPRYPAALLDFFKSDLALTPAGRIADIGSGTGILSELFLANGNPVTGVEPNAQMRQAGDEHLREFPNFSSVNATAENTGLPAASFDFVVAGQAFHWFDPSRARVEFRRILSPNGWVVLVWNERKRNGHGFDAAYDTLVQQFAVDKYVDHHTTITSTADQTLGAFFGPEHFRVKEFENFQELSLDDVKSRILSSSYMPMPDHPSFPAMMALTERAFADHAINDTVRISYDTRAYYGKMSGCSKF
jgi:ubiquinone/menaquinone biosynthesis C-methylase UbiE